jgi:hypothetical protein
MQHLHWCSVISWFPGQWLGEVAAGIRGVMRLSRTSLLSGTSPLVFVRRDMRSLEAVMHVVHALVPSYRDSSNIERHEKFAGYKRHSLSGTM